MRHLSRTTATFAAVTVAFTGLATTMATTSVAAVAAPASSAATPAYRVPAPASAQPGDNVGFSIASGGGVVLVGAPTDNRNGVMEVGSVYVYPQGSAGPPTAILKDPSGQKGDQFGYSVAVSGDYAVVGAPYAVTPTDADGGKVYLFHRSGTTWTRFAATGQSGFGLFGQSVAIDGDRVAVSAPNSGGDVDTLFFRISTSGTTPPLTLTGIYHGTGPTTDLPRYNTTLAMQGNTLVIGDPYAAPDGVTDRGRVVILKRLGYTWDIAHATELSDPSLPAGSNLGGSVAIDGSRVVAGAPHADSGGTTQSGLASVFVRSTSGAWAQQSTLDPGALGPYQVCGASVQIHATVIIVGCPYAKQRTSTAGAAWVYRASGAQWVRQSTSLKPTNPAGVGLFSRAISVSDAGDGFYFGAPGESGTDSEFDTGAFYFRPVG